MPRTFRGYVSQVCGSLSEGLARLMAPNDEGRKREWAGFCEGGLAPKWWAAYDSLYCHVFRWTRKVQPRPQQRHHQ